MPALPTTEDVRHVRQQAEAGVTATIQVMRNPLLAALGVVDAATSLLTETLARTRDAADRGGETQYRLLRALNEMQSRVSELPGEISELRYRLEPTELRRLAEQYRESAQQAYASLVERGEEALGELRSQPRVQQALGSVESGVDTAQERLETVVRDLNIAVEELRSRFARTSRSVGEKVARGTETAVTAAAGQMEDTAHDVTDAVLDAGVEAAAVSRGASRRVADRAAPPRRPVTRRPGDNNTRKG